MTTTITATSTTQTLVAAIADTVKFSAPWDALWITNSGTSGDIYYRTDGNTATVAGAGCQVVGARQSVLVSQFFDGLGASTRNPVSLVSSGTPSYTVTGINTSGLDSILSVVAALISAAVGGLGTMSLQDADAVAITGGTTFLTGVSASTPVFGAKLAADTNRRFYMDADGTMHWYQNPSGAGIQIRSIENDADWGGPVLSIGYDSSHAPTSEWVIGVDGAGFFSRNGGTIGMSTRRLTKVWTSALDVTSVTITGGTITGITDLAVADGGTGASTAAAARSNLGAVNIAGDTMTGDLTVTGVTVSDTDGTGTLNAAAQATAPSAPSAGTGKLFTKKVANRERPHWRASTGSAKVVAAATWSRSFLGISPQSSTSLRQAGMGTAFSANGTVSHPAITSRGLFAQFAGAASASANSGMRTDLQWFRGTAGDLFGGFAFHARLYLPDASYDQTGASTGSRIGVGMTSASNADNINSADYGNAANHAAMFYRVHTDSGAQDTVWRFTTADGTTKNTQSTGMTFTAQHIYEFHIECALASTTVYWQIDDITAGTSQSGSSSSNLPGASTALMACVMMKSIDATARNIQFAQFFAESDVG